MISTWPGDGGLIADDEISSVETDRLVAWWDGLADSRRREAFAVGTHTPMPMWMVSSLIDADVPGLVDAPDKPEGLERPWCYMPTPVARLIARRRRGDDGPVGEPPAV